MLIEDYHENLDSLWEYTKLIERIVHWLMFLVVEVVQHTNQLMLITKNLSLKCSLIEQRG